jgi:hypothetical protein
MRARLCLDGPYGDTRDGIYLQVYTCHGGLNQKWNLNGPISVCNASKCMEVGNYNRENGATAQIWDCYGGANQQWDYYP